MNMIEHRLLPWDTEFFGFPVATITGQAADRQSLVETLQTLGQEGVRLAYWNCPSNDQIGNEAAVSTGGRLSDLKLTYARPTVPGEPPAMPVDVETVAVSADDRAALTELALQSAGHSRFKLDPQMPAGAWRELFETWMDKSLTGEMADMVMVVRHHGRIAGMVTLSCRRPEAQIGLLAVDEQSRGNGIAGRLLQAVLHEATLARSNSVMVVTQGNNAAACHAYEKAGYSRRSLVHTYHFWL